MSGRRNYKVKPEDFRQRVRRFPRDVLLKGIALEAAKATGAQDSPSTTPDERKKSVICEGYLFHIAGMCVTRCNNYRNARVDQQVINDLVNGCYNIWDPELDDPDSDSAWQKTLSRIAYIQMPFQQSSTELSKRTISLFGDDPRFGPPLFDVNWWNQNLGVTLPQFLKIGLVMYVLSLRFGGSISRQTLLADNCRLIFEPMPFRRGLQVVDSWLARPIDEIARLGREDTKGR